MSKCPKCQIEMEETEPKDEWVTVFKCPKCGYTEELDWVKERL